MYYQGKGRPQDTEAAAALFEKAAKHGHEEAQKRLIEIGSPI